MKCKNCGANMASEDIFCPECGSSVPASKSSIDQCKTQEEWVTHGRYEQKDRAYDGQPARKSSGIGLNIAFAVAAVAFIIAIGILVFLLLHRNETSSESPAAYTTEEEQQNQNQASVATTQQKVVATTQQKAVTSQAKKETAEQAVDYILPDSSNRYLTSKDVSGLSASQLRLARNEIYARHGRKFNDEGLQTYFGGKSWYKGTISPDDFIDEERLSQLERDNIKLIQSYEE